MKTSTHSILMTVYHCRLSHLRNPAVSRMKDSLNDGREFAGPKRRGKQHHDANCALLLLYSVCFPVNAGHRPEARTQKVPLRRRRWQCAGQAAVGRSSPVNGCKSQSPMSQVPNKRTTSRQVAESSTAQAIQIAPLCLWHRCFYRTPETIRTNGFSDADCTNQGDCKLCQPVQHNPCDRWYCNIGLWTP